MVVNISRSRNPDRFLTWLLNRNIEFGEGTPVRPGDEFSDDDGETWGKLPVSKSGDRIIVRSVERCRWRRPRGLSKGALDLLDCLVNKGRLVRQFDGEWRLFTSDWKVETGKKKMLLAQKTPELIGFGFVSRFFDGISHPVTQVGRSFLIKLGRA